MPPKQRKHYCVFTPGCTTQGETGSERREGKWKDREKAAEVETDKEHHRGEALDKDMGKKSRCKRRRLMRREDSRY